MLIQTISVQGTIIKLVKRIVIPRGRIKKGRWKEKDFGSTPCTGIRMKFGKVINVLIEDDITGDVNTTFTDIQTLETFVHVAIAQEHTLF